MGSEAFSRGNLVVDDALGEHLAREGEVVHHHFQLPAYHLPDTDLIMSVSPDWAMPLKACSVRVHVLRVNLVRVLVSSDMAHTS